MRKIKSGFTLAETMIVLVILGVIAAFIVPSLIQRNIESQNRTKIKKTMAVYDTAVAKMVLMEDNIKTEDDLKNADCDTIKKYFKVSEQGENNCQFKTSDGLWWDVGSDKANRMSMAHPIIAFKESDLNDGTAKGDTNKAFYLATSFDENAKAFRSNDLQYEKSDAGNYGNDMEKLYAFINNKKLSANEAPKKKTVSEICLEKGAADICEIELEDGTKISYKKLGEPLAGDDVECPNWAAETACKDFPSKVGTDGPVNWIADDFIPTESDAKKYDGSTCEDNDCVQNGDKYNAAKQMCAQSGGRLANLAELQASDCGGNGCSNGYFWSSEEYNPSFVYTVRYGPVTTDYKHYDGRQAVCVGQ